MKMMIENKLNEFLRLNAIYIGQMKVQKLMEQFK